MQKDTLTLVVAVVGTVLVLLTAVAPILFSAVVFIDRGEFHLDFLMPAELFPMALVGGLLLFWATMRARAYRAIVGWGIMVAMAALASAQSIAIISGLASGEIAPEGPWWAIASGLIFLYWLLLAVVAVGGVMLLRRLYGYPRSRS